MSEVRIRTARPDEFAEVLELWRDAAAFATTTDDLDGLRALHAGAPDALLIAGEGEAVVGTVIAGWDGWRGGIYRLVVARSHRRRGLGTQLVRAAVAALESRGARRIAAVVEGEDTQAMTFWRAMSTEQFEHDATQTRFTRTVRAGRP